MSVLKDAQGHPRPERCSSMRSIMSHACLVRRLWQATVSASERRPRAAAWPMMTAMIGNLDRRRVSLTCIMRRRVEVELSALAKDKQESLCPPSRQQRRRRRNRSIGRRSAVSSSNGIGIASAGNTHSSLLRLLCVCITTARFSPRQTRVGGEHPPLSSVFSFCFGDFSFSWIATTKTR